MFLLFSLFFSFFLGLVVEYNLLHFITILHLSLPCIQLWCQDLWVDGVSFQDQFHELKGTEPGEIDMLDV